MLADDPIIGNQRVMLLIYGQWAISCAAHVHRNHLPPKPRTCPSLVAFIYHVKHFFYSDKMSTDHTYMALIIEVFSPVQSLILLRM